MASFKEIVTKAVIGKGKKFFKNNYVLEATDHPNTVLGCWVINHSFKGYKSGDKIGVDGSYDINIWYSYDNDSKTGVLSKRIDYNDTFTVRVREDSDVGSDTDIIVRALKQPNCTKVTIQDDGKINFDIEKELGVEIVGETKVKIAVEDDEEPWEIIADEVSDEEIQENLEKIDEEVQEEYL